MFFFLLQFVFGINIVIEDQTTTLTESTVAHQIVLGYFKANGGENCTYEVSIKNSENKYNFYVDKLNYGIETWFSFGVKHGQELTIIINAIPIITDQPLVYGMIEYQFDTEINTFDKTVAKEKKLKPAVLALTNLENIIKELNDETERILDRFREVHLYYEKIVRLAVSMSLISLGALIFFSVYEIIMLRRFFIRKKLI